MCLQLNEGTTFSGSVRNLSVSPDQEDARFNTFIKDLLIDPSTVTNDTFDTLNKLYSANDSSLGGRFNTGDSLFDRAEAWYTDNMYLSPRRHLFDRAATFQPLFGYFFTEFIPGQNPANGGMSLLSFLLIYRSQFSFLGSSVPRVRAHPALRKFPRC